MALLFLTKDNESLKNSMMIQSPGLKSWEPLSPSQLPLPQTGLLSPRSVALCCIFGHFCAWILSVSHLRKKITPGSPMAPVRVHNLTSHSCQLQPADTQGAWDYLHAHGTHTRVSACVTVANTSWGRASKAAEPRGHRFVPHCVTPCG